MRLVICALLCLSTSPLLAQLAEQPLPTLDGLPLELARFHVPGTEHRLIESEKQAWQLGPGLREQLEDLQRSGHPSTLVRIAWPLLETGSPELARFFPGQRFYIVPLKMEANPEYKGAVAIPFGMYQVIMVNRHGQRLAISPFGNYPELGSLLASHRVKLQTVEDAEAIVTVYSHLYRRSLGNAPARQISATEWHLAPQVIEGTEYYYEVRTDEAGIVESGRLVARSAAVE